MMLRELLTDIDEAKIIRGPDVDVQGISMDSRTIKSGDLFVAINGNCFAIGGATGPARAHDERTRARH